MELPEVAARVWQYLIRIRGVSGSIELIFSPRIWLRGGGGNHPPRNLGASWIGWLPAIVFFFELFVFQAFIFLAIFVYCFLFCFINLVFFLVFFFCCFFFFFLWVLLAFFSTPFSRQGQKKLFWGYVWPGAALLNL